MQNVMFNGVHSLTKVKEYTNKHLVEVLEEWGYFVKGHI